MQRCKYIVSSESGKVLVGSHKTELELSSVELSCDLLNKAARQATADGVEWNPFNVRLAVWAQDEPKPIEEVSFDDLLKFIQTIFDDDTNH